jgi:hypothetical protein
VERLQTGEIFFALWRRSVCGRARKLMEKELSSERSRHQRAHFEAGGSRGRAPYLRPDFDHIDPYERISCEPIGHFLSGRD